MNKWRGLIISHRKDHEDKILRRAFLHRWNWGWARIQTKVSRWVLLIAFSWWWISGIFSTLMVLVHSTALQAKGPRMNVCMNSQIIDRFLHGITPRFRWNFQRVLPESCDILSLLCHVMNDKKKVHTVHRLIWATNLLVWEAQRKWIRNGPNTLPGSSVLFWATNGTDGTSWKWSLRRS